MWTYVLNSPSYIPRSRMAGSQSNSVFSILKTCQKDLKKKKSTNTFPKWLHRFTFPPAMYTGSNLCTYSSSWQQRSLIACLHVLATLVCVKWYLTVALNYISLSRFLVLIRPICIFPLSCLLSCKSSLYFLDASPLSDIGLKNLFSHSVRYLFTFFIASSETQKFSFL